VIDLSNPLVNPSVVPGDHNLFVCGNDVAAKAKAAQLIAENFGWKRDNIVDLGDISNSRRTEMYLALWIGLWANSAHRTSTSTSFAPNENVLGRSVCRCCGLASGLKVAIEL